MYRSLLNQETVHRIVRTSVQLCLVVKSLQWKLYRQKIRDVHTDKCILLNCLDQLSQNTINMATDGSSFLHNRTWRDKTTDHRRVKSTPVLTLCEEYYLQLHN